MATSYFHEISNFQIAIQLLIFKKWLTVHYFQIAFLLSRNGWYWKQLFCEKKTITGSEKTLNTGQSDKRNRRNRIVRVKIDVQNTSFLGDALKVALKQRWIGSPLSIHCPVIQWSRTAWITGMRKICATGCRTWKM